MVATEDIGKNEVIIKVPSKHIISTRAAFYSDLSEIFYNHPELFGKHIQDGEDMMVHAFMLHEIQKGKDSQYYQMIKMWPKDTDILMNWDEESLEELQDPTLMQEAEKQYNDLMDAWNRLYEVLSQYTNFFKPESISLYKFKWVFILTTNRCFSSNWPSVCQMVPFADQINHENVTVNYDCLDPITGESLMSAEEKAEKARQEEEAKQNKKKEFLVTLKNDLEDLNQQFQGHGMQPSIAPGENSSNTWRIQTRKENKPQNDKDLIDEKTKKLKDELEKQRNTENKEDECLSSGLESDNDLDLLVEQEVLQAMRMRKQLRRELNKRQKDLEDQEAEESNGSDESSSENDGEEKKVSDVEKPIP